MPEMQWLAELPDRERIQPGDNHMPQLCGMSISKEKEPAPISEIALRKINTAKCMTIEKEAAICNLRRFSGETLDDIATEVGVTRKTVSRILNRNGIHGNIRYHSKGYTRDAEAA